MSSLPKTRTPHLVVDDSVGNVIRSISTRGVIILSVQICTGEYLLSDSKGFGFSRSWLPQIVTERFATSTRDGTVDRAPDQVPFIDTNLVWTNTFTDPLHLSLTVQRAPRTLITSNPNLLVLDDAVSWDIGAAPSASAAVATHSGVGARIKFQRFSASNLFFGREFADFDDSVQYQDIGVINPAETVQVRYRCLFSTPGQWRVAIQPRHEASARFARLRLWSSPYVAGVI